MEFTELRRMLIEKEFSRMNDMQKKAVFGVEGAVLILAGAGSGKTTVLVNRIAYLIKYGDAYNTLSEVVEPGTMKDWNSIAAEINKAAKDAFKYAVEIDKKAMADAE